MRTPLLRFRRPAVAVLVLIALWPSVVFGQAQRAGLVTLLEGQATVRRVALPQPLPLKFKDDVFLHDRVETGEGSLVRLLLGGAALVTIRARTVATITESPGKSTIDLASGKIAVSVAKDRMRPGESIEIRTLNALAGIRGTVVVAEVSQATAQVNAAAAAALTTNFYVLQGIVNVQNFNPLTKAPLSQLQTIVAGQNFRATGAAPPIIAPNPPTSVVTSGLTPSKPQHTESVNQDQVRTQAVQGATALIQSLLGSPTPDGTSAAAITLPATATFPDLTSGTLTSPTVPITPFTNENVVALTGQAPPSQPPSLPPSGGEQPSEQPSVPGEPVPPGPLDGLALATPIQPFQQGNPSPVVVVTTPGGPLEISGPAVLVIPGSTVQLDRPLLTLTEQDVSADTLVSIQGSLISTTTSPLIAIDPSTITTTGDLINVSGAMSLAGPLLTDAGDTLDIGANLLTVGGTLTASTSAPLVHLVNSTMSANHILQVTGSAKVGGPLLGVDASTLFLDGTLLTVGGTLESTATDALVRVANSFALFGGATAVDIAGGGVTTAGALLRLEGENGGVGVDLVRLRDGGRLTSGGPVVELMDSSLTLFRPVVTLSGGSTLQMTNGAVLTLTDGSVTADALISATGSGNTIVTRELLHLSGGATVTLDELVQLGSPTAAAVTIAPPPGSAVVVIEDGRLAVTGPASLTYAGSFARVQGTNTSTAAVLSLTNTTLTGTTADAGFVVNALGQGMTMLGPLLEATNATLSLGGFGFVLQEGTITSETTLPFLTFTGTAPGLSAVTTAQNFLTLSGAAGGAPPTVTLAGPLVSATNTTFSTGNPNTNVFGFMFVGDGATLTSDTAAALLAFDHSTVTSSANLVSIRRSPSVSAPTTVALTGPLFSAVNGSVFDTSSLGFGTIASEPGACCSAFTIAQGAELTSSTSEALIQLTNSTLRAGPDSRSGSHIVNITDVIDIPGELVASASVRLQGPLLSATDGTVSALFHLLNLRDSLLTSATTDPLIALTRTTGTFGGLDPFTGTITSGRLVNVTGGAAELELDGPLIRAVDSNLSMTSGALGIFNGATVHSDTTDPLMTFSGGTVTTGSNFVSIGTSPRQADAGTGPLEPPPNVSLNGPLLSVNNAALTTGTSGQFAFIFVGDSATFSGPFGVGGSDAPALVSFTASSLDSSSGFLSLRRSRVDAGDVIPTVMGLGGPLLLSSNSQYTTHGFAFAFVGEGAFLLGAGTKPLMEFSHDALTNVGTLFAIGDTAGRGDPPAPALVALNGGLVKATNTTVNGLGSGLSVTRSFFVGGDPLTSIFEIVNDHDITWTLGGTPPGGSQTYGALFSLSAVAPASGPLGDAGAVFNAPLLRTTNTGGRTTFNLTGDFIGSFSGAALVSNTTQPFVTSDHSTFNIGDGVVRYFLSVGNMGGGTGTAGAVAAFAGPVLKSTDDTLNITGGLLSVFNGGSVTKAGPSPMFDFTRGSLTTGPTNPVFNVNSPTSSLTLGGPLITATGSTLRNGNAAAGTGSPGFVTVANGAQVTATTTAPLLSFDNSAVHSAGNFFQVRTQAQVTLAGPVLEATNGSLIDTTSLGFATGACCSVIRLQGGASLTSTTTAPLISVSGASMVNAGPDAQSGGLIFNLSDTGVAGEVTLPPVMTLAGGLLSSQDSAVTSLFSTLQLVRSTVTSTTTNPLIQLDGSSLSAGGIDPFTSTLAIGRIINLASSQVSGTPAAEALLSTNGPLIVAVNSSITSNEVAIVVQNGAMLTSSASAALVRLDNSVLIAGSPTFFSGVVWVGGTGGPSGNQISTIALNGPLLELVNNSQVQTPGALATVVNGGRVTSDGSTSPFISFDGSSASIGSNGSAAIQVVQGGTLSVAAPLLYGLNATISSGGPLIVAQGDGAITTNHTDFSPYALVALDFSGGGHLTVGGVSANAISLFGSATQTFNDPDFGAIPTLGTERPLRHQGGGAMLDVTAARTDLTPSTFDVEITGSAFRVDTALVEATAPIVSMLKSAMKTNGDAVTLFQKARVEAGIDVLRLDQSRLDILNGNLVTVGGGSLLRANNLLSVANGSRVNIVNGTLLTVTGNAFAKFGGCLVCFIGANSIVSVSNGFTATGTLFGFPISGTVQLGAGATASSVFPGVNTNGNQLNVTGVLLKVDPGSTLKVQ